MPTVASHIRRPRTAQPASLTFRQVAGAYNFPLSQATGRGCTVVIIELGGGFTVAAIDAALAEKGIKRGGTLTSVTVGSGRNHEDGPDGADGEVQSDILGVLEVAPDANVVVVFGGNSDADFYAATDYALTHGNVASLSWGGAETEWDAATLDKFAARIAAGAAAGVPLFVASGDSGSDDSTSSATVDFPASAPASIACGGTRLTLTSAGARAAEVTWDDSDTSSASGGGVSKHFPGRDVPDIAGNADPDSGYEVTIDGDDVVIGGTSLVAPLFAGGYALLFELNGGRAFDFRGLVIANPAVCFDVTSGDNGAFRAGPGRDETTGFGVPDGGRLLTALKGTAAPVQPTPPSQPVPPTTPVSPGDPLAAFPTAAVNVWLLHKHNHTQVEATAAADIVAWAAAVGITLTAA